MPKPVTLEESLYALQELGLTLNEYKVNNKEVPVEEVERLLDVTIDAVRLVVDQFQVIDNFLSQKVRK